MKSLRRGLKLEIIYGSNDEYVIVEQDFTIRPKRLNYHE